MWGDVMAWVALVTAGLFETGFAVCLKLSNGQRVPWPVVGFALCAPASFGLLTVALREVTKLVSISLILAGVVGLNLSGASP